MKLSFARFATLSVIAALAFSPAIAQSTGSGQASRQPTPITRTDQPDSVTTNSADQPLTTVSVRVKVVNVLATVRDKHGKIANGLTKDDFTLSEDGRPQTIKYFARETDLPLTLGMLVDTSLSQRRVLGEERSASESFLAQILREDQDKAFVIHFDREVELLQDLTASHEKLHSALESLATPQFTRTSSGGGGPGGFGGSLLAVTAAKGLRGTFGSGPLGGSTLTGACPN